MVVSCRIDELIFVWPIAKKLWALCLCGKKRGVKTMLKKIMILTMVFALAVSMTAFAQEATTADQNAGTKLARGGTNLLAGWLEFPKQIYVVSRDQNPYIGLTYGFVKGLYEGIAREGMGVFETVTCVIPPYDKVFIEPEYVFQGWEK